MTLPDDPNRDDPGRGTPPSTGRATSDYDAVVPHHRRGLRRAPGARPGRARRGRRHPASTPAPAARPGALRHLAPAPRSGPAVEPARHRSGQGAEREEHFVPPEPPPVPRATPARRAAWFGLFLAPLAMLAAVVLGWVLPDWLSMLLVAALRRRLRVPGRDHAARAPRRRRRRGGCVASPTDSGATARRLVPAAGRTTLFVSETVEISGHLIDTGILSRVLDDIREYGGDWVIDRFDVGHEAVDLSRATITISNDDDEALQRLLMRLQSRGVNQVDPGEAETAAVRGRRRLPRLLLLHDQPRDPGAARRDAGWRSRTRRWTAAWSSTTPATRCASTRCRWPT